MQQHPVLYVLFEKKTHCNIWGQKPEGCRPAKEFNRMTAATLIDKDFDCGNNAYDIWMSEVVVGEF